MVGLGGRRRWGKGTSQIFLTFDDGLDCRKKCKKITQKIALKNVHAVRVLMSTLGFNER